MKSGYSFRCLAFQEKDGTFTGVCLDLDIVEEKHQTLEEAVLSLNDAIEAHLKAAAEVGYPKELLYRPAPQKYWNKLAELGQKGQKPTLLERPVQFFNSTATISASILSKYPRFVKPLAFSSN